MTNSAHDPADPTSGQDTGTGDTAPADDTHAPAPAKGDEKGTKKPERTSAKTAVPNSSAGRLGSAWVGLVLGAVVTILLLVFIVQNNTSVDVNYFGWTFEFPLGVLVLLAAIAGALIMALFAGVRILQLRMRAHKARKMASR